jgi:hypothetical protein
MAHRDAWDSSATANMTAQPHLSTVAPQRERAKEGERGKGGRKVCDVALTCGTHRLVTLARLRIGGPAGGLVC